MAEQGGLVINYDLVEERVKGAIKAIEAKPHVRFIRYLLTKRYSPRLIKQELFRLGLSAPHEPNLTAYFLIIIDPIIKKHGLSSLYASYKNNLLRKTGERYSRDMLNYSLNLGDDLDGQVKFNKFVKEMEIDILWIAEIYRFHGSADKLPIDEEGNRILDSGSASRSIEKILVHPKRYLIDKMILQSVPDDRIVQYCKENYKMSIYSYDLNLYRRAFFNLRLQDIEQKIKLLEIERNSLNTLLKDLTGGDVYSDLDIGERSVIKKQTEQRITELDDNIKTMNMLFSDFAFKSAQIDCNDFGKMFQDMLSRGYKRFCELDTYRDRDVVDPLLKVTRLMTFAHDKLSGIANGGTTGDKHSAEVLMELYKKRTGEIFDEQIKRANQELADAGIAPIDSELSPEEIAGIEDLGVSFDIKEDEAR